jgi:hypothetical protein
MTRVYVTKIDTPALLIAEVGDGESLDLDLCLFDRDARIVIEVNNDSTDS